MAGYVGTVYVWCSRRPVPKDVRECIDDRLTWVHVEDPFMWPKNRTDFYVQHTALNKDSERAAGVTGGIPVVMPTRRRPARTPTGETAADWLRQQIWHKAHEVGDVYVFVPIRVGEDDRFPMGALKRGP